jgi:hypothetical protein
MGFNSIRKYAVGLAVNIELPRQLKNVWIGGRKETKITLMYTA